MFFTDRDRQEREEAEREGRTLKEEDLDDVDMPNPFQPITNVVSEVSYHNVSFKYNLDEIIKMKILNSYKNHRMKTDHTKRKRCKDREKMASRAVCKNRQSFQMRMKRKRMRRMKRARDRPRRAQNQVVSFIPQKDSLTPRVISG